MTAVVLRLAEFVVVDSRVVRCVIGLAVNIVAAVLVFLLGAILKVVACDKFIICSYLFQK